jgi:hypothetical protein
MMYRIGIAVAMVVALGTIASQHYALQRSFEQTDRAINVAERWKRVAEEWERAALRSPCGNDI